MADDRPFDQDRVRGHRIQQLIAVRIGQAELVVLVLAGADDRPRVVGAQQLQHMLQIGAGRCSFEISHVVCGNALLVEYAVHGGALRTLGVEPDRRVFCHGGEFSS